MYLTVLSSLLKGVEFSSFGLSSEHRTNIGSVNVYYVMGFRPKLLYFYSTLVLVLHFTCTAHLCHLYKALMYIFSLRNTIQFL